MMRVTKFSVLVFSALATASVYANSSCEKNAKTRDDSLACMRADTDQKLKSANDIYQSIRPLAKGEKLKALDGNFSLWQQKLKSDCDVLGKAFNEWGDDYTPDTDFQIASCRKKIAQEEVEFYSWIACPDDMESASKPKCKALRRVLGE